MSFPRSKFRASGRERNFCVERTRNLLRPGQVCATTWTVVVIALVAGEVFGQGPKNPSRAAQELTTKEISQYLISRNRGETNDSNAPGSKTDAPPLLSAELIVAKMLAANARRSAELRGFQGKRWYNLQYHGLLGGREASMEVLATYSAPDQRKFSVISESGSKLLLNRVLLKLLDSEREAFEKRKQIELSPLNYKFELAGAESAADGIECYVLAVKPRKPSEFLYNGRIWVNASDFAVIRMQGEPAKSPSFWIRDTKIDSNWERIGNFWFIAHNHSVSHIRMGGMATLTIDYGEYQVTSVDRRAAQNQAQSPELPDPASVTPQR